MRNVLPVDRIHENAMNIVNLLLENEAPVADVRKACANCEREFGVHDPNASHGVCKRHTIEHIKEAGRVQNKDYSDFIRRTEAKPDSAFAPDLAKPENAEYRASLGPGKTQGQTDRLEKVRAAYFPQT